VRWVPLPQASRQEWTRIAYGLRTEMRLITRYFGIALGVLWLVFAAYYAQLAEETILRRAATCTTYIVLGVAFLLYGLMGKPPKRPK
jgi:hypothetical protein